MAKPHVLDKVTADLSHGRTQPAIQRLSSLVAAHPTDLDLRRRLAAVHRRVGNLIEAGRWDYLTPGVNPAETAAFERAFPSPQLRLRALRWPVGSDRAPTEYARRRLDHLVQLATTQSQAETRQPDDRVRDGRRRSAARLAAVAIALAVAAFLVVLGAVTLVQWLI